MTRGTAQDPWPDRSDDEYPDFLWPDDEDEQDDGDSDLAAGRAGPQTGSRRDDPGPFRSAVPPAPVFPPAPGRPWRRIVALTVTAAVALALGATAVLIYRGAQPGSTPAAAASRSAGPQPGQGGQPGAGSETVMMMIGRVTAVGAGTITIGAGPAQSVTAAVTSTTRFTGSARTLRAVHVGDTVSAQITEVNGVARVVSLQDPVSES